jgi:hypothetical protein
VSKVFFEESPLYALCISGIEPMAKRVEQTVTAKREIGHCEASEMWALVYSLLDVSLG